MASIGFAIRCNERLEGRTRIRSCFSAAGEFVVLDSRAFAHKDLSVDGLFSIYGGGIRTYRRQCEQEQVLKQLTSA